MPATEQETFADIEPYRVGHPAIPSYEFPFTVLDPTPGGSNLGRIRWNIELYPAARKRRGEKRHRRLGEVWVWANQTRDPRYQQHVFKFEAWAEMLSFDSLHANFRVSSVVFCDRHKGAVVLSAYPENHHTKLVIEPSSSIMFQVRFA